MIKHSWHHVSKRSCILGSKLFALLIIIMRHIQPFLQHGQHNRISLIVLLKSTYTIFHFLFEIKFWTYTWPNSWAMVNAALNPLSCTIAQLCLPHMVPNSARPNVSQFSLGRVGLRQISSLWKSKRKVISYHIIFLFYVIKVTKKQQLLMYLVRRSATSKTPFPSEYFSFEVNCMRSWFCQRQNAFNISDAEIRSLFFGANDSSCLRMISLTTDIWIRFPKLGCLYIIDT